MNDLAAIIAADLADKAWSMASCDDGAIDRETHVTCAFARLDTSVGRICEQFGDNAGYFRVAGLEALTDREIEQAATMAINLIAARNGRKPTIGNLAGICTNPVDSKGQGAYSQNTRTTDRPQGWPRRDHA